MINQTNYKTHFFEGGNVATSIAVPTAFACAMIFYGKISAAVIPYDISTGDAYSYAFNLFAIEFGALLSLFGLFACRPTPFLERMKNTATFKAIVANTNITLAITTIAISITFAFAILKIQPEATLTGKSVLYLIWCAVCTATCCVYARTVRLIMTALA
jgi:hypothetical protein